ncbi:hypothetical protein C806_00348 [Lachnospiraceae bacterium 3-1]|nr:hypothetical protein C806_00348 [Lachnospiraceae bacterium 3-1]
MIQKQQYRSIEQILKTVKEQLKDEPKLFEMFQKCYTNTLDTTLKKCKTEQHMQ